MRAVQAWSGLAAPMPQIEQNHYVLEDAMIFVTAVVASNLAIVEILPKE